MECCEGHCAETVVAAVVLGAIWLLLSPVGDARPHAHAALVCNNYVDATVYNDTKFRMDPYFVGLGVTNFICDDQDVVTVNPGTAAHLEDRRRPLRRGGARPLPTHKWR